LDFIDCSVVQLLSERRFEGWIGLRVKRGRGERFNILLDLVAQAIVGLPKIPKENLHHLVLSYVKSTF
jgi:hypothetical protein